MCSVFSLVWEKCLLPNLFILCIKCEREHFARAKSRITSSYSISLLEIVSSSWDHRPKCLSFIKYLDGRIFVVIVFIAMCQLIIYQNWAFLMGFRRRIRKKQNHSSHWPKSLIPNYITTKISSMLPYWSIHLVWNVSSSHVFLVLILLLLLIVNFSNEFSDEIRLMPLAFSNKILNNQCGKSVWVHELNEMKTELNFGSNQSEINCIDGWQWHRVGACSSIQFFYQLWVADWMNTTRFAVANTRNHSHNLRQFTLQCMWSWLNVHQFSFHSTWYSSDKSCIPYWELQWIFELLNKFNK